MSDRHALFMVTDFAPLPSIGRIRTQKWCKFLPEFGWRTSVLTIQPPPGVQTDPDLLAEIPAATAVHRVRCPQPIEAPVRLASRVARALRASPGAYSEPRPVAGSAQPESRWLHRASGRVDRVKQALTRQVMIPDSAVTALPGMVRAAVDIIRNERVDVLIASVPGFSPWLAAAIAGLRTGVPVVVDYRDLWHRDVLRTWIGPVRRRLELAMERWALARSQAVIGASEGKTAFVRDLDRSADGKAFTTIYNGFDEDDLLGLDPRRLDCDAGRVVLLYAGRLYGHRRIDPLIESVGRLVAAGRIPRGSLRLRMLGSRDAEQQRRLDAAVNRYGLHDVVEAGGYVTRREALARQLGSDAAILIVDPGETSAGVLPGKITEYVGLGQFVLAVCPPGEARNMLERYGHAAWASVDQPEALDRAVLRAFEQGSIHGTQHRRPAPPGVGPSRRRNAEQLSAILSEVLTRGRTVTPSCAAQRGNNPLVSTVAQ